MPRTVEHNMENPARRDIRFNAIINLLDGAAFGAGMGFASFITIIPLFVSQLTDSAILIGLVPAIHNVGWQLPQLLTAGRIRRLSRYKPMVMTMTIHERLPFLGLALVAYFLPSLKNTTALLLIFGLLIWQGLGGGMTATVWQVMIGKIIPVTWRGRFFGAQSSMANMLASGTAVLAGLILDRYDAPLDFTLCFALAGIAVMISFGFLAAIREQDHTPAEPSETPSQIWRAIKRILSTDSVFRRFLLLRMIFHFGLVAVSYYTVFIVNELDVNVMLAGWLTGTLLFAETIINPLFGVLGDRLGHRLMLFISAVAALVSTGLAGWVASIPLWFLIFILTGVAYVGGWTTSMVISLEFGSRADQPIYVALSNTLIAPATLAAPFLAGWCINTFGYPTLFRASAALFVLAAGLGLSLLRMGVKTDDKPIVMEVE